MGTNYYIEHRCESCGHCREEDKIHIGKSSSGWAFALAKDSFCDFEDLLKTLWNNRKNIYNEYGGKVKYHEVLSAILCRDKFRTPSGELLRQNDATIDSNKVGKLVQEVVGEGEHHYFWVDGEFS